MGKLDELRRTTIGNVDESMGVGRGAVHGAPPPGPRPVPGRMQGLVRSRDAAEIAVDRIGPETVTYVSNIYKYYLAYQMVVEHMKEVDDAKAAA